METLKRTHTTTRMELKVPKAQLENAKETLTNRMSQAEDRISVLKDKIEDLDQIMDLFPKRTKKMP